MMDNSAPQQESEKQQSSRFSAVLQILDRIENWLTRIFEFSEEEQEKAGVRMDDERQL
jgi:hypothetical protein